MAAGLAGGSADAAATLVACNELWRTGLSQAELCELAAGIGSDVAFGLVGGTAVGVGRGERVTPALVAGTYHWVLAFATGGLSTAQVYAACDRIRAARGRAGEAGTAEPPELDNQLMAALRSGKPGEVAPLLANDLQSAATSLRPGCAGRWPRALNSAHWARSSPAPARPAPTWPRTHGTPRPWPSRWPVPGCAARWSTSWARCRGPV